MEFRKIKTREIVLISIAGILTLITIFSSFQSKGAQVPNDPAQVPVLPETVYKQPQEVQRDLNDEDEAVQREMKDQMERDRNQQRQIKMLKMQLEQINLQLDNEKALTEINKLKKENAGYVKDPDPQTSSGFPNIRIIYIGGTDMDREAILSIDGTSYSVKQHDRPVANMEVLGVTDQGVKVHFIAPEELTTIINYVQD